jgi:hypothetical protein
VFYFGLLLNKKGGRNENFIKKRPKVIKGVFHRGESYCGKCLEVCHTGEPSYSRGRVSRGGTGGTTEAKG